MLCTAEAQFAALPGDYLSSKLVISDPESCRPLKDPHGRRIPAVLSCLEPPAALLKHLQDLAPDSQRLLILEMMFLKEISERFFRRINLLEYKAIEVVIMKRPALTRFLAKKKFIHRVPTPIAPTGIDSSHWAERLQIVALTMFNSPYGRTLSVRAKPEGLCDFFYRSLYHFHLYIYLIHADVPALLIPDLIKYLVNCHLYADKSVNRTSKQKLYTYEVAFERDGVYFDANNHIITTMHDYSPELDMSLSLLPGEKQELLQLPGFTTEMALLCSQSIPSPILCSTQSAIPFPPPPISFSLIKKLKPKRISTFSQCHTVAPKKDLKRHSKDKFLDPLKNKKPSPASRPQSTPPEPLPPPSPEPAMYSSDDVSIAQEVAHLLSNSFIEVDILSDPSTSLGQETTVPPTQSATHWLTQGNSNTGQEVAPLLPHSSIKVDILSVPSTSHCPETSVTLTQDAASSPTMSDLVITQEVTCFLPLSSMELGIPTITSPSLCQELPVTPTKNAASSPTTSNAPCTSTPSTILCATTLPSPSSSSTASPSSLPLYPFKQDQCQPPLNPSYTMLDLLSCGCFTWLSKRGGTLFLGLYALRPRIGEERVLRATPSVYTAAGEVLERIVGGPEIMGVYRAMGVVVDDTLYVLEPGAPRYAVPAHWKVPSLEGGAA